MVLEQAEMQHAELGTPEYIWNDGICNLDLVERTVCTHVQSRIQQMEMTGFYDPVNEEAPPFRPAEEFVVGDFTSDPTATNVGYHLEDHAWDSEWKTPETKLIPNRWLSPAKTGSNKLDLAEPAEEEAVSDNSYETEIDDKPVAPEAQSVELRLISEVWNGNNPANYVRPHDCRNHNKQNI